MGRQSAGRADGRVRRFASAPALRFRANMTEQDLAAVRAAAETRGRFVSRAAFGRRIIFCKRAEVSGST